MRWGELQKNHFQPSNSFFFSDLDSAPNLHPYTRTRIKFALGRAGLPTLGRAGLRHVILSRGPPAWAAQTPSGKPRASVAVVGCGETKQLLRLSPALPPRCFSPSTRFEHTLQTPAFFPSPKSQGGKRTPQSRGQKAKPENSKGFLLARPLPSLLLRVPCTRSRYRRRRTEVWSTCFWIL